MEPVNIEEYYEYAKSKLAKMAFDYYDSGAEDQITLKKNHSDFSHFSFLPRVLRKVGKVDISCKIFNHNYTMPIMIAPTAMQRLAHDDGECATVRAAVKLNNLMVASCWSNHSIEHISKMREQQPLWAQVYIYKDRALTTDYVQRAKEAGISALCLTVDTPKLGRRERDIRNKFTLPAHLSLGNFVGLQAQLESNKEQLSSGLSEYVGKQIESDLGWDDLDWLRNMADMPVILKGVMHPEDARQGLEHGCAGIWVSNHGGRQLDGTISTIRALAEVSKEVNKKVPVFFDGGIRRGTDVLKAIALGADAVFVGRPVLWGLAYNGEAGVVRVCSMLKEELELSMALLGVNSIQDISVEHLRV